jgi:thymidylate synthase (FAD)
MSPSASLVWITPNAQDQIVYCARVSNPQGQSKGQSQERLLRYLAKHKHWSPFEMASACFEINTTRDIAAQILRHRSFSFQEFSQRYSASNLLGHAPVPELRYQDYANKQNSLDDDFGVLADKFEERIRDVFEKTDALYQDMLAKGVAKECARKVLPLNTPTRLYMSGTIRSWIHYLQIRTGVETQREHRQIAEAIAEIFREHLPTIHEALLCPTLNSPETKPDELLPVPPKGLSIGKRLSGFFERAGRLLHQYQEISRD